MKDTELHSCPGCFQKEFTLMGSMYSCHCGRDFVTSEKTLVKREELKNIQSYKKSIKRIEIFSYYASDIVSYVVGENKEIKSFLENDNLWFLIINDGEIVARVNSKFVSVIDY